jgi:pyruvate formate lyase activating enzyme
MNAGLHYAYVGNVPANPGENTYCPKCKKPVIERIGFTILANRLEAGRCQACGRPIAGIWQ